MGYQDISVYRQAIELNPIVRDGATSDKTVNSEASVLTTTPLLFGTFMALTAILLFAGVGAQVLSRKKRGNPGDVASESSVEDNT